MSVGHGKNTVIWLDSTNMSGYANSISLSMNVDTVEVTTFADAAKVFLEGDYDFTIDLESFFDATDAGWDEVAFDAAITNGGTQNLMVAFLGTTAGNPVYECQAKWTGQPRVATIGDAVKVNGSLQGTGTGGIARGEVILDATITGTGAQTGQNIGAVASGTTSVVTYRVTSLTGTITMATEESSDDASGDAYAAVAAYASGSIAADGVTRKTSTGAIEAWRRVNVTAAPTTAAVLVTSCAAPN